jgi:hypothetical protein
MHTISEEKSVLYWDFSSNTEFIRNPELFNDSDHLSTEGGYKFTELVIQELRKKNIIR